ncbi:MAG: DUF4974 domain-containing protein [Bacteroidia bacterium]|nr:DUF4974 domain-containing protein [Bacteroidia bacterium]
MTQEKNKKEIEIDSLLARVLQGEASKDDIYFFTGWIKDYRNEIYFDKFKEMWNVAVDSDYVANHKQIDPTRFICYMQNSIKRDRERRLFRYSVSIAASVAVLISIVWFGGVKGNFSGVNQDLTSLNYGADSVRVELNNGNIVKKVKGESGNMTVIDEKNISVVKDPAIVNQTAKTFNTVSTPSGERVTMVLSDGTKVYLTSNSYLKYPSRFDKDKREVTLVGRAYFEVTKSKVPFVVNTTDMNIEVLGTSFDVESRISATTSSVILVEGSVKVNSEGQSTVIHPDEQVSLSRKDRLLSVKSVDAKLLTMWKDGVLIVHGQTFVELVNSLSSWYGVKIIDRTSVNGKERFNGRFDREDIEAAIKAICISANIKYDIEDGKLILEDI